MSAPITHIVHTFFCAIAIAADLILIVLIFGKTPSNMRFIVFADIQMGSNCRTYSIILLYLAVIELSTTLASLSTFVRIMSTKVYLLDGITGVCKLTDSPRFCFGVYAFMMHGNSQQMILIAFCFCYRYFAIKTATQSIPLTRLLSVLMLIHIPTISTLGYYATTELFDPATTLQIWTSVRPSFNNSEGLLLISSRMDFPSIVVGTTVSQYTMVPVTVVVVVASVLIHRELSSTLTMSESSRVLHREITKGLLVQAFLPFLHLFAVLAYKLRQIGVVAESDELGHLTVTIGSITLAVSSFVTLISVRPYRRIAVQFITNGARPNAIIDSYIRSE